MIDRLQRLAYAIAFCVGLAFLGIAFGKTVGHGNDRRSAAAFFTIALSLALIAHAAIATRFSGRATQILAFASLGFAPVVYTLAAFRLDYEAGARPHPDASTFAFLLPLIASVTASPWIDRIESALDRFSRIAAPTAIALEVVTFTVAMIHAHGPAAPIGWTHLAGGGAFLAGVALLVAAFRPRAHGARLVAVTVVASTVAPLVAAMVHGLGI